MSVRTIGDVPATWLRMEHQVAFALWELGGEATVREILACLTDWGVFRRVDGFDAYAYSRTRMTLRRHPERFGRDGDRWLLLEPLRK